MTGIEHGGGIDAAIATYGGERADWLDLSTGINPVGYPVPPLAAAVWSDLPDKAAQNRLLAAARAFWNVPNHLEIIAAPGTSALIAAIPRLAAAGIVEIFAPTYGEHAVSFRQSGWEVAEVGAWSGWAEAAVVVNPNNPDGRVHSSASLPNHRLVVVDESFADAMPGVSVLSATTPENHLILKSFGKFWGLAGLRLGFAICAPDLAEKLRVMLGPWPVSGPALAIGALALSDRLWRDSEINRLHHSSQRLNALLAKAGFEIVGGTPLFTLVKSSNAAHIHQSLTRNHILTRKFDQQPEWLRFGLPRTEANWLRLQTALAHLQ